MMKEKLQYLQGSVICLVLTLIFALSSLRPAFALQPYPVTMSMQSTHLCFIQSSVPFIELYKGAAAETGAAAVGKAETTDVGVAAVTKEAVAVTEGVPALADIPSGTNVATEVGEGIATMSKAVAFAGETTSVVVPQIESTIALVEAVQGEVASEKDSSIKLDEYESGTGFSGVYNLLTEQLGVKPSVNHDRICLKNGEDVTSKAAKRTAGHSDIENELIINAFFSKGRDSQYKIFTKRNVGFFFTKDAREDKTLKIEWRSGSINRRNFGNACAPNEYREIVKKAIREKTGYQVVDGKECKPEGPRASQFCTKGVNLKGANLEGSDFENTNWKGANLEEAKLERANLKNAILEGANLKNANLKNAILEGANLKNAILEGANLEGANLKNANQEGANLERANLKNANQEGASIEEDHQEGASLQKAMHLEEDGKLNTQ